MPTVTIVLPAYRHARFVGAAIGSVLAQTFDDWELLVIDDFSPDGTWDEIRRFRDPRISAVRHARNEGAHASLNEGLARARGRYVAVLNSDDVYDPGRLERTVLYLENTGADLVGTGVTLIGEGGLVLSDPGHQWHRWHGPLVSVLRETGDLVATLLAGNIFVTTSNFVFRRELAQRVGGFEELRYAHDYAFLLRAAAEPGVKLAFLPDDCLLSYRVHDSNTIRENEIDALAETYRLLLRALPFLLPGEGRLRMQMALRHLSALGLPADPAPLLRTETELAAAPADAEHCRRSWSNRLGSALVRPFRRAKTFPGR